MSCAWRGWKISKRDEMEAWLPGMKPKGMEGETVHKPPTTMTPAMSNRGSGATSPTPEGASLFLAPSWLLALLAFGSLDTFGVTWRNVKWRALPSATLTTT